MQKNARLALICAVGVVAMVGAAFAAVPLYRAFCQVTGFDGTVRKADKAPDKAIDKIMTVRFDTNVNGVDFAFVPETRTQDIKIGETALAFFKVTNRSNADVTARAVYNVVPETAGPYFQKLECFCFTEQTIKAGQTIEFPMTYFIDPEMATDPETNRMKEVTLSYTFFPSEEPKQAARGSSKQSGQRTLGGLPAKGL